MPVSPMADSAGLAGFDPPVPQPSPVAVFWLLPVPKRRFCRLEPILAAQRNRIAHHRTPATVFVHGFPEIWVWR